MNNKYLGTLSMAKKASKLLMGADVCYDGLEDNVIRLLIFSSDSSENSTKSLRNLANGLNVPVVTVPCDKLTLGSHLGKATVAVCGITDIGFANAFSKKLLEISDEYKDLSEKLDLKLKRKLEREETKKDPSKVRPKKNKEDNKNYRNFDKSENLPYNKDKKYKEKFDKSQANDTGDTPPKNAVKWSKFNK